VLGEGGQGRELLGTEAAHDVRGIAAGPLVAGDEPAHGGDARAGYAKLLVNVLELVPGVDGELSLVGRAVGHVVTRPVRALVEVVPRLDPAKPRDVRHEQPEHVIERAILEHQHDDVPDARIGSLAQGLR
jgi:hypothetical protein